MNFARLAVVSVSLVFARRAQSTDLTLVPGAIGEDVVDATIAKVEALNLFPNDLDLLKRIALVESNFGSNVSDPLGGIWQISSQMLLNISASASVNETLYSFITLATHELGSRITNLSNSDFSIPLRSALAARLYIQLQLGSSNAPGTISAQASWWANNYNLSGDPADYRNLVTGYEKSQNCSIARLDMWILLDGSGSVRPNNFITLLQFVANFTSEFDIAVDAVRVGFSIYSSFHIPVSMFDEDTNNTQLINKVLSTPYPHGGTNTGQAIQQVVSNGFLETNGLRPLSAGVPRVLIILTDGQSNSDVTVPSDQARGKDILVYAVGIGDSIRRNELNEIANDTNRVFQLADFSELMTVLTDQLNQGVCQAVAVIPDNATAHVRIPPGNTYYSTVQLPNNGSVTLEFYLNATSDGSGTVYISATISRPSPALHDLVIILKPGQNTIAINSNGNGLNCIPTTSAPSQTLYIALRSTSTETLHLKLQPSPSPVRAAVMTLAVTTSATVSTAQSTFETISQSVTTTTVLNVGSVVTTEKTAKCGTRHNPSYDAPMLFGFILIWGYLY